MEIYGLLYSVPYILVLTVSQCAKRIDVKKRMADGLAKRALQRTVAAEEGEIVSKKDTTGRNDMLNTVLKYRKGINTDRGRIQYSALRGRGPLTLGSVGIPYDKNFRRPHES